MKTLGTFLPKFNDAAFQADVVIKSLGELQPRQARIIGIFSQIFPALHAAVKRGVPRKLILQQLEDNGIKLNAASFKKLYEAEQKRLATTAAPEKEAS
ncbi:MAG: hypothetical protein ACT6UH_09045 [Hydrogenophaga sp.]|uniref:hypothetical protein n=1 Tax=Hydrogenophaga sp. TaxID=1904254 RepID=UPI0040354F17